MENALNLIYDIYTRLLNFLFHDALLFEGVSLGYVFLGFTVFAVLIGSILSIPFASYNPSDERDKALYKADVTTRIYANKSKGDFYARKR